VGKTYNRLKTFEELGLDVAEIEKYLSKVEALLKGEDSPFETVKTQIIGNFEVISKLETTFIFANIDELTNQINQLESQKGNETELTDQIDRLNKEIEELNKNVDILTNENEKLKNLLSQQKNEIKEIIAKPGNSISMKFTLIPAGEFDMGSKESDDERPVHKVKIKNSFYLGTYPVTQREWKAVMGDNNNPSTFNGDDLPVELVSWDDVQEFIKKFNEKEGTDKYRLPSEAEWEYACRAGTTTRYSFGDDESKLDDYGWYNKNSDGKTHPVGQKEHNPWGLYDMHGNVWEWVQDEWHSNYDGAHTDGSAWETGDGAGRVIRGGSWNGLARYCRSANRGPDAPRYRRDGLGFRILQEV
jgi:formylglycine-generating enzyme required for sulfatase activity